jgi:oligopeptide transport system permease protein
MPDPQRPDDAVAPEARLEGGVDLDEPLLDEQLAEQAAEHEETGPDALTGEPSAAAVAATAATGGLTAERPGSLWGDAWRELRRNPLFLVPAAIILLLIVVAAFPGVFATADPRSCDINQTVLRPSAEHWFGTDIQGCDYYSKVLYGTRVSLMVGIGVAGSAAVIAVIFGMLAGYYGGAADAVIARITDIWFGIPYILGAIVILTVMQTRGVLQVVIVLAAVGWPTMLRLMRGSVLGAKAHDYVMAARGLGASPYRLMTRHILPNAIAPVIVYATILVGISIATEATLSYLGAGLQVPAISWGLMISVAQKRVLQEPHLLLFPGAFLSVTVFSFVLLGDALRDALDPKLR